MPTLPSWARLPINRCNLPAVILGSLTFQRHPTPLVLDGVGDFHRHLFVMLDDIAGREERSRLFLDYLAAHFRLNDPEAAGLAVVPSATGRRKPKADRTQATWQRALRGWSFDADSRDGAVLKGWVESRFGLLPRFHGMPLRDFNGNDWRRYTAMRSAGLYGTNALEAQFDLLYTYCQYEFRRGGHGDNLTLYRGTNRVDDHEVLASDGRRRVVVLNNLVSFSASRERAGEFGDYILTARVPVAKIFFHCALLPGVLRGEDEHLVIGGAYEVELATM